MFDWWFLLLLFGCRCLFLWLGASVIGVVVVVDCVVVIVVRIVGCLFVVLVIDSRLDRGENRVVYSRPVY